VFKRFLPQKQDPDDDPIPASEDAGFRYDAVVEEEEEIVVETVSEEEEPGTLTAAETTVASASSSIPSAPSTMPESVSKNILSSDVKISGSIEFEEELFFDGQLEGEIHSEGTLTVGENAQIAGDVFTKAVTVLGKVTGNITVQERCELKSRAQLIGDLRAARLTIEEGAIFEGKSEVNPTKTFSKGKAGEKTNFSKGGSSSPSGGGSSATGGSGSGGGSSSGQPAATGKS